MPRAAKPVGQATRGKTALNRLRQIDVYMALAHPGLLRGGAPLIVDVGFGAAAWTTLEMRTRWLGLNPRLRVVGLEIDPLRVAEALPHAHPPQISFRLGGFNVSDALQGEKARLIRCYNVLRQYDEDAVKPALDTMSLALEPGGILIEGTSNPSGRMVVFDLYQKASTGVINHHSLVFGSNFRALIEPADFQTILPKRLIHRMRDPLPAAFFAAWQEAFWRTRHRRGIKAQWISAARLLQARFPVSLQPGLLHRGYLVLRGSLQGQP